MLFYINLPCGQKNVEVKLKIHQLYDVKKRFICVEVHPVALLCYLLKSILIVKISGRMISKTVFIK